MANRNNKRGQHKQGNRETPIHTDKNTDRIFTYSAIEQKRHGIAGPGKCLMIFLGIFPFVPLFLELFSCYVMKLEDRIYKTGMFLISFMLIAAMFVHVFLWINRIFYVFIIDEKECLYRLRISNFWYRIKNQTFLLNPMGASGGRLIRTFYMLNNIRCVLDNITDTVTYEELISMGQMEKFTDISGVVLKKKKIIFKARIQDAKLTRTAYIKISRVYENDRQLVNYLQHTDYNEKESVSRILEEVRLAESPLKKIIRFTVTWSCIIAWAVVIFLSRDLSRLSKINAGEYVKSEVKVTEGEKTVRKDAYVSSENESDFFLVSDYGKLYKPILIVYVSVEIIYLISKCTDLVIIKIKKAEV